MRWGEQRAVVTHQLVVFVQLVVLEHVEQHRRRSPGRLQSTSAEDRTKTLRRPDRMEQGETQQGAELYSSGLCPTIISVPREL